MYVGRRKVLSSQVNYLVMYRIVTCGDDKSIATAERVMHRKYLQATITFILKVRGLNVIMCT